MKTERKIYLAAVLLLIAAFAGVALWFRSTQGHFVVTGSAVAGFQAAVDSPDAAAPNFSEPEEEERAKPAPSARSLAADSALVARIGEAGNRLLFANDVLTKVTILEVYKGDGALVGTKAWVYEPVAVRTTKTNAAEWSGSITLPSGYVLMQEGAEYIAFLTPYEQPEGYVYSEREKATYLLTGRQYGKYPLEFEMPREVKTEYSEDFLYGEIAGYALYTPNKAILERYQAVYEQVKAAYLSGR